MASGGLWWPLVAIGGLWWPLVALGGPWEPLRHCKEKNEEENAFFLPFAICHFLGRHSLMADLRILILAFVCSISHFQS